MSARKPPARYQRRRWNTACRTMKNSNRAAPCRNRGSKPCSKCDASQTYCEDHANDHIRYHIK